MVNSINGFGFNQQIRQNPDEYAKVYAEQNGISVEEAKVELKSKYGDPQAQNENLDFGSVGTYGNFGVQDISSLQDEIAGLEEKLFGNQTSNSLIDYIMNFFKGENISNQSIDTTNQGTGAITGPQKEGDPQPHLENISNQEMNNSQSEFNFTPELAKELNPFFA